MKKKKKTLQIPSLVKYGKHTINLRERKSPKAYLAIHNSVKPFQLTDDESRHADSITVHSEMLGWEDRKLSLSDLYNKQQALILHKTFQSLN